MKTLIAIPCHESLDVRFVESLTNLQCPEDTHITFLSGSLVYDARNQLAQKAVALGADYVLWLDSDMVFEGNLLGRLFESIQDKDLITGLYFTRKMPPRPTVYERCSVVDQEDGSVKIDWSYQNQIPNEIFEIEACGFGCVLMKTSMLAEIKEKGGLPFSPMMGLGEDLSFCIRARALGYKLYCDPRIILGHVSQFVIGDEETKAEWNKSNK